MGRKEKKENVKTSLSFSPKIKYKFELINKD